MEKFDLPNFEAAGVVATENPNRFIIGDWNQAAKFELSGNRLLLISEIK